MLARVVNSFLKMPSHQEVAEELKNATAEPGLTANKLFTDGQRQFREHLGRAPASNAPFAYKYSFVQSTTSLANDFGKEYGTKLLTIGADKKFAMRTFNAWSDWASEESQPVMNSLQVAVHSRPGSGN